MGRLVGWLGLEVMYDYTIYGLYRVKERELNHSNPWIDLTRPFNLRANRHRKELLKDVQD